MAVKEIGNAIVYARNYYGQVELRVASISGDTVYLEPEDWKRIDRFVRKQFTKTDKNI